MSKNARRENAITDSRLDEWGHDPSRDEAVQFRAVDQAQVGWLFGDHQRFGIAFSKNGLKLAHAAAISELEGGLQ
jgi:hypothetical protein